MKHLAAPVFMALLQFLAAPLCADILPIGTTPAKLAGPFIFTESPLYDGNGGVYFSDLNSNHVNSHVYRYNVATGFATIVDSLSGGCNGTYFNPDHQMVTADRDRQQISLRSASDVSLVQTVLTSSYNGIKYNGPNDLVIDSAGGIYFTDPDYENRHTMAEGFYYRSPQGAVTQLQTFAAGTHPNGVILSPDQHVLYLAEEGARKILAYDVTTPGTLTNSRTFATAGTFNGPDGLTIDPAGNVYAAGQGNVIAWNPQGQQLFSLNFPEDPTNLDFGGADGKTLFVTAGASLYSVPLNIVVPEPASFAVLLYPIAAMVAGRRSRRRRNRNEHRCVGSAGTPADHLSTRSTLRAWQPLTQIESSTFANGTPSA